MIKAFTLMELMIVVVLIGILSAIGILVFGGTQDDAKKKSLGSDLNKVLMHNTIVGNE